jgi:predicted nucleic acid-binding Zn ribbon protein
LTAEALRDRQRRAARRTTIILTLVAIGIYVGFILMSMHRSGG